MTPSANVYVGANRVIVAPCHANQDGILYEQENPIVLSNFSPSDIGAAMKRALSLFSTQPKNLRTWKRSDWPAFRASGCGSIKQFERDFLEISVTFPNASEAFVRAELPLPGGEDYQISTVFNPMLADEVVGQRILGMLSHAIRV